MLGIPSPICVGGVARCQTTLAAVPSSEPVGSPPQAARTTSVVSACNAAHPLRHTR